MPRQPSPRIPLCPVCRSVMWGGQSDAGKTWQCVNCGTSMRSAAGPIKTPTRIRGEARPASARPGASAHDEAVGELKEARAALVRAKLAPAPSARAQRGARARRIGDARAAVVRAATRLEAIEAHAEQGRRLGPIDISDLAQPEEAASIPGGCVHGMARDVCAYCRRR